MGTYVIRDANGKVFNLHVHVTSDFFRQSLRP